MTSMQSNFGSLARRKLWLDVHLYLGLIAGAILAVVGLTGGHYGVLSGNAGSLES